MLAVTGYVRIGGLRAGNPKERAESPVLCVLCTNF